MKTFCVLMAAGQGSRFGGGKLTARLEGKPLYEYALEAIPAQKLDGVIVVSGLEEILGAAGKRGFTAILNDRPEEGVSRTIRLGLDEAQRLGATAAMFMVCDQPLLKRESVAALIGEYEARPEHIHCMGYVTDSGARRGNPAIFPGKYFPELRALKGDNGGSDVIRANPNELIIYNVSDPLELADADTREQLEEIKKA